MQVPLDLVNLFLYAAQQLGVMLGVGAQTILLITYAISVRDGVVDAKETQIARAVTKALVVGLGLIVLSGIAITAVHFMVGQWMILFAPAFLFKWALLIALIGATFLWRKRPFPDFVWEGIIGATWYALFMVHIIAPVASWFDLIVLYVVWVAGFLLLWSAAVFMTHKKDKGKGGAVVPTKPIVPVLPPVSKPSAMVSPPAPKKEEQKPTPQPVAPPVIKINVPNPVVPPAPQPAPAAAPQPPVVAPAHLPIIKPEPEKKPMLPENNKPMIEEHFGLPAIRVMPRTKEELAKHI